MAHRALLCSALSDGPVRLLLPDVSSDLLATSAALEALGASVRRDGDSFFVSGTSEGPADANIDCGESGTTLRFLLPAAASLGRCASFTGRGRLPARPLADLVREMKEHGVSFSSDKLPLTVQGKMTGGLFRLPGHISSQYISGILLSLPVCGGGEIVLTTKLESALYVDLTVSVMERFGITVHREKDHFSVPAGRYLSPGSYEVEGDWSAGAVWLCAGALSGPVRVLGLDPHSVQGDRAILSLLASFGAKVDEAEDGITVSSRPLHGISFDGSDIPDLIPLLSVVAGAARGETVIRNIGRLRLKESDRLLGICRMLDSLGVSFTLSGDTLVITGRDAFSGGQIDTMSDHRLVMAACLAAIVSENPIRIENPEAVNKSYPAFFRDYESLIR